LWPVLFLRRRVAKRFVISGVIILAVLFSFYFFAHRL
jgi:hypothetical protein